MHISPTNELPQDRYRHTMKFVVSSTELLSHLQAISNNFNSKDFNQRLEELYYKNLEQFELAADYAYQLIIDKPTETEINELKKGAIKELLRRLSLYLSNNTASQLLRTQNSIYSEISLFFGLCCSRPSYIFSAISGTSSHPVPATVTVLK